MLLSLQYCKAVTVGQMVGVWAGYLQALTSCGWHVQVDAVLAEQLPANRGVPGVVDCT